MRIEATDHRRRVWDALEDATGERTTSKALDVAARYYLLMAGDSTLHPTGRLQVLLATAESEGPLTAQEIAEVLDVEELPVDARLEWDVGVGED